MPGINSSGKSGGPYPALFLYHQKDRYDPQTIEFMKSQYYFQQKEYEDQPFDQMQTSFGEFDDFRTASKHAVKLSQSLQKVIVMHLAGKKEYHYFDALLPTINTCANCKHWRDKAWTNKGWGICDNPKNEVKAGPLAMIRYYLKDDPKAAEELAAHVEDGIRYPEDFGCIFYEAIDKK